MKCTISKIITQTPCIGGELELSADCSDGRSTGREIHNNPKQLSCISLVTLLGNSIKYNFSPILAKVQGITKMSFQGTPTTMQPVPTSVWQRNMFTGASLPMWEGEVTLPVRV